MPKVTKSSVLILTGVLLVPLFSACTPNLNQSQNQAQEQTQKQAQNEIQEMAMAAKSGDPIYCKLSKNDGGEMMEYWMKGKKIKVKTSDAEKNHFVINDSQYIYTWPEGESEGTKMRVPSEEEIEEMAEKAKEYADEVPDFSDEAVVERYEDRGYLVDCKKQNFSDAEFSLPGGVNFRDMSQLMEQSMQMGEEMMEKYDQGDMQEMQQKAKQMQEQFAQ